MDKFTLETFLDRTPLPRLSQSIDPRRMSLCAVEMDENKENEKTRF